MPERDDLLSEQVAFYRHRAPGYDDWWRRRGRYDRGAEHSRQWESEVAEVERALDDAGVTGDVLELAGGTGWWTQRLATSARRLTVVDAALETLELNRARVARSDVEYVLRTSSNGSLQGSSTSCSSPSGCRTCRGSASRGSGRSSIAASRRGAAPSLSTAGVTGMSTGEP